MDDHSRYPARVLVSDGRLYRKAALVAARGRVRVAEKQGHDVVVVLDRADVTSVERLADRTTLITLADGATLRVGKGEGCSCGSPLKSWYSKVLRESA